MSKRGIINTFFPQKSSVAVGEILIVASKAVDVQGVSLRLYATNTQRVLIDAEDVESLLVLLNDSPDATEDAAEDINNIAEEWSE